MNSIKPKIRICFILSHIPQGGAERQTINLVKGLNKSLYELTLIIYANTEVFYKEVFDLPVKIFIHQSPETGKLRRNISNAIYLRKVLLNNDFDILHTLLFHNGLWVRLLAPGRYSKRIVYSIRNGLENMSRGEKLIEKIMVKRSTVITNSQKVKQQYLDMVGKKYRIQVTNIYNGIDETQFISESPPKLTDQIIIGTVGRQTALKNQIQTLEAIESIYERYPLHFYLIGDKNQDGYLSNLNYIRNKNIGDYVTILDSQPDISVYYKMINVFILSSFTESCPNVLFEAMLAKCLCIVSSGANSDHFIRDGINGFVYDGSTEMLTSKLISAIELIRNGEFETIVENGQKFAVSNFSLSGMISNYEKIYQSIMEKSMKLS